MEWNFFHSKLDQHIPMVFDPFAELNVTWLFIFTIWIKRFFVANSEIHICIVLTMNGERVFLFSYRVPCMQQKLIWLTFVIFFSTFFGVYIFAKNFPLCMKLCERKQIFELIFVFLLHSFCAWNGWVSPVEKERKKELQPSNQVTIHLLQHRIQQVLQSIHLSFIFNTSMHTQLISSESLQPICSWE